MPLYDIRTLLDALLIAGECMRLTEREEERGRVQISLPAPGGRRVAGKRNRLKKGGYCY